MSLKDNFVVDPEKLVEDKANANMFVPCIADVFFPEEMVNRRYLNDSFNLKEGDIVFVDDDLCEFRGIVEEISYKFKVRKNDIGKIIAVADLDVPGEYFLAENNLISFDKTAATREKARSWYFGGEDENEYVVGENNEKIPMDNPDAAEIYPHIKNRGFNYYLENRVKYLSIDADKGYAIVQGTEPYELEFNISEGIISNFSCTCYCAYNCKHMYATMLQLRHDMDLVKDEYLEECGDSDYFSAINDDLIINRIIKNHNKGKIVV